MFLFVLSLQSMSDITFKSLFEGKQSKFENKVNVDAGLLSKLEEYYIITPLHRTAIEVRDVSIFIIEL